jgi:hypothetical protein
MSCEIPGGYEVEHGARLTLRCIWFDHKWEVIFNVPNVRVYYKCARKGCYGKRVQWDAKFMWVDYHDIDFYWVANAQEFPTGDPAWGGIQSTAQLAHT